MASSGTTTTGRLGDANNNVVLANNDASTGRGVICLEGITSEAFVSWDFGMAGSMMMTADSDKDAGTSLGVELVVESPKHQH